MNRVVFLRSLLCPQLILSSADLGLSVNTLHGFSLDYPVSSLSHVSEQEHGAVGKR